MAFEGLTEKLSAAFKKLRGKGRLSEADVKEAMKEIRMALLEADVNFKVVKQFVATVTERAIGSDVLESLTPAQMIVKIVNEELTALMGGENTKLTISPKPPTVVMLVGLNGAGKTTNGAKLAGFMKKQGKRPLLVACDTFRPAAITQLEVVGQQVDVPVFQMGQIDPVDIARAGIEHAKKHGNDIVFIDTAGRLHVDEELMEQLKVMKAAIDPTEILLIVDAMIGQDAVNAAKTFDEAGRRCPGRCGSLYQGGHRQAHQICGCGREAGPGGALLPRPHGLPYSGHGRRALPHREGPADL